MFMLCYALYELFKQELCSQGIQFSTRLSLAGFVESAQSFGSPSKYSQGMQWPLHVDILNYYFPYKDVSSLGSQVTAHTQYHKSISKRPCIRVIDWINIKSSNGNQNALIISYAASISAYLTP